MNYEDFLKERGILDRSKKIKWSRIIEYYNKDGVD